jgi:hypothetical protein
MTTRIAAARDAGAGIFLSSAKTKLLESLITIDSRSETDAGTRVLTLLKIDPNQL